MMNKKPLTVEEVEVAAEQFFPLFDVVRNQMPVEATIEDTLKVMVSMSRKHVFSGTVRTKTEMVWSLL
ncbi:MAG: hypothetical protein ACXABD_21140 [Candidatus Thorarchaeota archaeon]|jgi:hypothetical protein